MLVACSRRACIVVAWPRESSSTPLAAGLDRCSQRNSLSPIYCRVSKLQGYTLQAVMEALSAKRQYACRRKFDYADKEGPVEGWEAVDTIAFTRACIWSVRQVCYCPIKEELCWVSYVGDYDFRPSFSRDALLVDVSQDSVQLMNPATVSACP